MFSSIQIGFFCLGLLLIFIAVRIPIGISLGWAAFIGLSVLRSPDVAISSLATITYTFIASWTLTAIPMFILMGAVAYHTGLTSTLFNTAKVWLNFLPGGLAIATNVACAGFAAASGSSMAMAGSMSRIAIPEMLKAKYDPGLASGVVASAGTLGAYIPPSIPFILYAIFMEASVGQLLIAGILPGLVTLTFYILLIVIRVHFRPAIAPKVAERYSMRVKLGLLREAWPLPVIIIGVIGGMYSGLATATEAAALGVGIALIAALTRRQLTWRKLWVSAKETVLTTSTIFLIAIGAIYFSTMITFSQIPAWLAGFLSEYNVSSAVFLAFVVVYFLIAGMFLDAIGLMLLTLPILQPFIHIYEINVIWFGVIVVKLIEIGLLTPPVGLNLFTVYANVKKDIDFKTITLGTLWFLLAEVFIVALLFAFPALSTYLPMKMMGQ